jgi:hypothetical protein
MSFKGTRGRKKLAQVGKHEAAQTGENLKRLLLQSLPGTLSIMYQVTVPVPLAGPRL